MYFSATIVLGKGVDEGKKKRLCEDIGFEEAACGDLWRSLVSM